MREGSAVPDPATTRTARARSLVGRLRARLEEGHGTGSHERSAWPPDATVGGGSERHVHAVPAETGGQLGRAVTLFNASEHVGCSPA